MSTIVSIVQPKKKLEIRALTYINYYLHCESAGKNVNARVISDEVLYSHRSSCF